jgi:arylsulfatase A-like enzyme
MLKAVTLAVGLLGLTGVHPTRADDRPNILLLLADDMGYSDISPYGSEIFTPNIARLADQGLMLTNFHVAAYCAPTRSMLLTGVDNHRVGLGNMIELVSDNQRGKPGYEGYLNGNDPTIATVLRNVGYHTYLAGKWHLGKTPDSVPAGQGFENLSAYSRGVPTIGRRSPINQATRLCISLKIGSL